MFHLAVSLSIDDLTLRFLLLRLLIFELEDTDKCYLFVELEGIDVFVIELDEATFLVLLLIY